MLLCLHLAAFCSILTLVFDLRGRLSSYSTLTVHSGGGLRWCDWVFSRMNYTLNGCWGLDQQVVEASIFVISFVPRLLFLIFVERLRLWSFAVIVFLHLCLYLRSKRWRRGLVLCVIGVGVQKLVKVGQVLIEFDRGDSAGSNSVWQICRRCMLLCCSEALDGICAVTWCHVTELLSEEAFKSLCINKVSLWYFNPYLLALSWWVLHLVIGFLIFDISLQGVN